MKAKAFRAAFPYTLPILAGFWFLGMTYGIYMSVKGFSFLYPMFMAMTIFGGSLEFVTADLLCAAFNPMQAFLLALMIQARHLFYGIAMLDKYRDMGWKRFFLIFGMCDETFSINCTAKVPEGVDPGWFMLWVSFLNWLYWVTGAAVGGLLGARFAFDTEGLDFVMTAMFTVIFLEQCLKEKKHWTALIGFAAAFVCLLIFGADDFLLPTMAVILTLLTAFRTPIEREGGFA
ncbi:MAG: AzlC family ABC transporter permease [Oscillospiraceae bacterium]|jgi:4-azaleucine resistance transporter AzlC